MFKFNNIPELKSVCFDGKTPYNVIVRDCHAYDVGEYDSGSGANTAPFIRILAEEQSTRTPIRWNLKFFGTAPRYFKDPETGIKTQCDCERVAACKNLSRALGMAYTTDIELLYQKLDGACIRVIPTEEIVRDEDGEPIRNDDGTVRKYYKVRYLAPEDGAPSREPSLAERINSDNAAKAEAKRAKKNQRAYPGNTGEA